MSGPTTPAERAVAWGLVVEPDAPTVDRVWWAGPVGYSDAVVWCTPDGADWYTPEADGGHDTEDAALTAYLDAVGAP